MNSPRTRITLSLSPVSLVVSLLALLLAVSGTAFAAGLAAHSVGTKQLKDNAVTGAKIKNRSVTAQDLAPGTVPPSYTVDRDVADTPVNGLSVLKAAGLHMLVDCSTGGGAYERLQLFGSASGSSFDLSGTVTRQDGAGVVTTSNFFSSPSAYEPNVQSGAGTATLTFDGTVRVGTAPAMHLSFALAADPGGATPCHFRALLQS